MLIGGVWLIAAPRATQQPQASPPQVRQALPGRPAAAAATSTTPIVGTPTATPATIVVNTPTLATVTASITPAPISNGANLLRLGATGTQSTIIGVMHDDGKNGDLVAGDGIYTFQVPFNEATAGQIQLQVSAAFQGQLKRITSNPITLRVWGVLFDPVTGLRSLYPPGLYNATDNNPPGDFILSSTPLGVNFGNTGSAPALSATGFNITILISQFNADTFDINQWLVTEYPGEEIGGLTPITIGGQAAYEFQFVEGQGSGEPLTVVYHQGTIFQIAYSSSFDSGSTSEQAGLDTYSLVLNNISFSH